MKELRIYIDTGEEQDDDDLVNMFTTMCCFISNYHVTYKIIEDGNSKRKKD